LGLRFKTHLRILTFVPVSRDFRPNSPVVLRTIRRRRSAQGSIEAGISKITIAQDVRKHSLPKLADARAFVQY
jgi:hypothetical protein